MNAEILETLREVIFVLLKEFNIEFIKNQWLGILFAVTKFGQGNEIILEGSKHLHFKLVEIQEIGAVGDVHLHHPFILHPFEVLIFHWIAYGTNQIGIVKNLMILVSSNGGNNLIYLLPYLLDILQEIIDSLFLFSFV